MAYEDLVVPVHVEEDMHVAGLAHPVVATALRGWEAERHGQERHRNDDAVAVHTTTRCRAAREESVVAGDYSPIPAHYYEVAPLSFLDGDSGIPMTHDADTYGCVSGEDVQWNSGLDAHMGRAPYVVVYIEHLGRHCLCGFLPLSQLDSSRLHWSRACWCVLYEH